MLDVESKREVHREVSFTKTLDRDFLLNNVGRVVNAPTNWTTDSVVFALDIYAVVIFGAWIE